MSDTTDAALAPDLYDYDFENDPIATLDRLREEDPVHWSRHGFWYLTRYDHVSLVLKDAQRFSSAAAGWGASSASRRRSTPASSASMSASSRTRSHPSAA